MAKVEENGMAPESRRSSGGGGNDASRKRRSAVAIARRAVRGFFLVTLAVGTVAGWGTGSVSSFGWSAVSVICPVGALEDLLASRDPTAHVLIAFAVVAVASVALGRFFCGWMCPVPPVQSLFGSKKAKARQKMGRIRRVRERLRESSGCAGGCGGCAGCAGGFGDGAMRYLIAGRVRVDSRIVVLIGALVASLVAGFPVFCLVCPVGLTFAFVFSLAAYVATGTFSVALVVCPLAVVAEVVLLRRWCHVLCPIGALLSLLGRRSTVLRPCIDAQRCLRTTHEGSRCLACADACPEGIDLCHGIADYDCIRCGKCVDACPVDAVSFSSHVLKVSKEGMVE